MAVINSSIPPLDTRAAIPPTPDASLPEVAPATSSGYASPENPHDAFIDTNKFAGPIDITATAIELPAPEVTPDAAPSVVVTHTEGTSLATTESIRKNGPNGNNGQRQEQGAVEMEGSPMASGSRSMSPPPGYVGSNEQAAGLLPPSPLQTQTAPHRQQIPAGSPQSQPPYQGHSGPHSPVPSAVPSPLPQGAQPQGPGQAQAQPANQAPVSTPLTMLKNKPANVLCPNCGHFGLTHVMTEVGGFTHMIAALVCCVTACGCIPYFISGLKDKRHTCTQCNLSLAKYHRSGRTEVLVRVIQGGVPLQQAYQVGYQLAVPMQTAGIQPQYGSGQPGMQPGMQVSMVGGSPGPYPAVSPQQQLQQQGAYVPGGQTNQWH